MNKPNIEKSTREELIAYIGFQESVIGGVSNLVAELKVSCDVLAKDVKRANEGKENGFILLNEPQKLSRLMNLIKNIEYFEALENGKVVKEKPIKSNKSETENLEKPQETDNLQEITRNPFELISERVKKNGKT